MAPMEVEDESAKIAREGVLSLIQQKDALEAEIQAMRGVLNQNNVGMTDPLVDSEGFPRNDIDVYQVRHARHRIICLQNDHKSMMRRIESGLHNVHAEIRRSGIEEFGANSVEEATGDPFVRVNFVANGSPADIAGVQLEDKIVEFGTVNSKNFQNLQDVNKVVQASVNMVINVKVLRQGRYINIRLTPKTWSGRGLLGCNILPLESVER